MSLGSMIQLAFFWVSAPCFCRLILSLPLSGLASKSTSLGPGFCVHRPRQYDMIGLEVGSHFWILFFSWLIVWADGANNCSWCLAGGSGS